MRKLIFILGLYIFITGCSVTKRGVPGANVISSEEGKDDVIKHIENQNISNKGFFIQKAEIEVLREGNSESFIASVKYAVPGNYLISLRGKSGIEAARIFITKDTIIINDRINRELLFGNPDYIERKYGFPTLLLPLIFGDLIPGNKESEIVTPCKEGTMQLERNIQGVNMTYIVDCKKGKILSVTREGGFGTNVAGLKFEKFINSSIGFLPSVIKISYKDSQIFIKILKFEIPWEGEIEFIPGSKYEQIELL